MIEKIKTLSFDIGRPVRFMEVCGTHTVSIQKNGLRSILPEQIKLVSGPGCPVCVTDKTFIDKAVTYLRKGYHIFTFGDMLRVPGNISSLIKEDQRRVYVVYSPLEVLDFAEKNPDIKILFLGIGFETTVPLIASLVKEAKIKKIENIFLLSACKVMPPVLAALLKDKDLKIDGFLLPGHVSAIIGLEPYRKVFDGLDIKGVVAGFEGEDILQSLIMLLNSIKTSSNGILNQYRRVVDSGGNIYAQEAIKKVFRARKDYWRGIGEIDKSGLMLSDEYQEFDIEKVDPLKLNRPLNREDSLCKCGDVIKGKVLPRECPLFSDKCTPENPVGPCMVSSEGACSAYYKYKS